MISFEDFVASSQEKIGAFNGWATSFQDRIHADHIGYKCATTEEFERLRAIIEMESSFIYQSFISGRRIALCKFKKPLSTVAGDIHFLELSDQKPDGSQKSGFDHVEIYPVRETMEQLVLFFAEQGSDFVQTVRPHHATYDQKLLPTFSIRIEPEPLIRKIVHEEIVVS